MKAMTVVPGQAGSAAVTEFDEPIGDGEVLVQGRSRACFLDRRVDDVEVVIQISPR